MAKVTVARDAITHVVALVLENRSFDHILGDLGRSGALKVDGGRADMSNADLDGRPIGLNVAVNALAPDLPHDFGSVATALSDSNGGFVRADQLQNGDNPAADVAEVEAAPLAAGAGQLQPI